MNINKNDWQEKLTPKTGTSHNMQKALDWWHGLSIQNLQNMNDSWVGYLWKYYPEKTHPYHLTGNEIQYIWTQEQHIKFK